MEKLFNTVNNYIYYLKKECGLSISLHFENLIMLVHSHKFTANTYHDNAYCVHIKKRNIGRCCLMKKFVCTKAHKDFSGCCWAGVYEHVFPFKSNNQVLGFISVTGYRIGEMSEKVKKTLFKIGYGEEVLTLYQSLKPKEDKPLLKVLTEPLSVMLQHIYLKLEESRQQGLLSGSEPAFAAAYNYILENFRSEITLSSVARALSYSASYISHLFKKNLNISVTDFITGLRVTAAKQLLKNTDKTVTEISQALGFSDSNYFSSVFKRNAKTSPLAYRRQAKEKI